MSTKKNSKSTPGVANNAKPTGIVANDAIDFTFAALSNGEDPPPGDSDSSRSTTASVRERLRANADDVGKLRHDFGKLDAKMDVKIDAMDAKLVAKMDAKFDVMMAQFALLMERMPAKAPLASNVPTPGPAVGGSPGGLTVGVGSPLLTGGLQDSQLNSGLRDEPAVDEELVIAKRGLGQMGSDRRHASSAPPPSTNVQIPPAGTNTCEKDLLPAGNDPTISNSSSNQDGNFLGDAVNPPNASTFMGPPNTSGSVSKKSSKHRSKRKAGSDAKRGNVVNDMFSTPHKQSAPPPPNPGDGGDDDDDDSGSSSDSIFSEGEDGYTPSKSRDIKSLGRGRKSSNGVGTVRIHQQKDYTGTRIIFHEGKPLEFTVLISAIIGIYQYRAEKGMHLYRWVEIMDDSSKDYVMSVIQDSMPERLYSAADLLNESEGKIIDALLKDIKPTSAKQYQRALKRVVMKPVQSTLLAKYGETLHRQLMAYTQDFYNMWSLLRFDPNVYNAVLRKMRRNGDFRADSTNHGLSAMYGASDSKSQFEPSLLYPWGKQPKSNNKLNGEYVDKPQSLLEMFLDGMGGSLGGEMYAVCGFHDNGSGDDAKNVHNMSFPQFIGAWRKALFDRYKEVQNIIPLVRALATVNYSSKEAFKNKFVSSARNNHVHEVNVPSEDIPVLCEVCSVDVYRQGKAERSTDNKDLGVCLSFIMGKPCTRGPACLYQHTREAVAALTKRLAIFAPPPEQGYNPSKAGRQELVGNKVRLAIKPRIQAAVNAVPSVQEEGGDSSDSVDEDAQLEEWERQQVHAVNFESPY